MIRRADSLLVKLLTLGNRLYLLRWLPVAVEACRVQYDTTTWVRIYGYSWLK